MKNILNYDTCVIACSGPSLNKIDVFSLGLPVVAISTAIRKLPNPDYWVCSDYINEMHADEGKRAYENADIVKIFQEDKIMNAEKAKNLFSYKVHKTNKISNVPTDLFDFTKPFIRGPHKSVTFAIQWAHSVGIKNLIFAGNDLYAPSMEEKYCYAVTETDKRKKHNFLKTLNEVKDTLVWWYGFAKAKGYEWYSWECGQVFDSVVPNLTEDLKEKFTVKDLIQNEEIPEILNEHKHKYLTKQQIKEQILSDRIDEMNVYAALMEKIKKL